MPWQRARTYHDGLSTDRFGDGENVIVGTNGDGVGDDREGNTIVGMTQMVDASNITLAGNRFGTDRLGQKLIGQGSTIDIFRSSAIRVGTNSDGVSDRQERNIVNAGRSTIGVWVRESSQILVAGNYIGTNATGTAALGNLYGVLVASSGSTLESVTIGGISAAAGNVISGNAASAIRIAFSNSTVMGNIIGLDAGGRTGLSNESSGIELEGARVMLRTIRSLAITMQVSADLLLARSLSKEIALAPISRVLYL